MLSKIIITIKVLFYFFHRMLIVLTLPFRKVDHQKWQEQNVQNWANYCLKILNIELSVERPEGGVKFPEKKATFIVCNHQSYTDIPTLYVVVQRLFGFVAKVELGRIPLLNYWMKQIGCIMIDRKKYTNAIRNIKRKEKNGDLNPLVVFPEGTRSKNGEINAFKMGVLKLAWSLRANIQPVVLYGTRASWEERGKAPFPVKAKILDPVEVTPEMKKDFELYVETIRNQMVEAYKQLKKANQA